MSVQVQDLLRAKTVYLAALDEVEAELRDRGLESIAELHTEAPERLERFEAAREWLQELLAAAEEQLEDDE